MKENKKNILRTGWTNPAMFFAYPADIRKVFPTDESVKKWCGWQSRPRPEMDNAVECASPYSVIIMICPLLFLWTDFVSINN
nr:hypothetical protein [Escherichia coli]